MPLTPDIRAIYSPSYNISLTTGNPVHNPGKGVPIAAKIGGPIGLVVFIFLVALLLYFLVVRPRRRARAAVKPELDAAETEVKLPNEGVVAVVDPVEAERAPVELGSDGTARALDQGRELDSRSNNVRVTRELDGSALIELPA
jgi:preprotein translocase subunit YajC